MKPLICFILAAMIALPLSMSASAASKKHCVCKQYKKQHYSSYYVPGYCEQRCCKSTCRTVTYCHPGRYISCRTDFYYHHGRNTSKVEVCG